MTKFRQRKLWLAALAIVFVFAACKGETPTAPPVGGGNPPTGGGTTPTGISITLSASPQSLEVDRTSVITATVTSNGAAVPDGTAVEFTTTNGTFADTGQPVTIRTTTGGVATASLSATATGTAVVTVTVQNVSRNTQVVFGGKQYSITVAATPTDLETGQNSVLVANVTHGAAPVPDGTQVEFTTTTGTFTESGAVTAIVTTTNGVARATLTSGNAGTATVSVKSGGATGSTQVTFRGSNRPTVTGITPNFGRPQGGETIRIQGTNFRERVRVFFDVGETQPREAMVVSVTPTEITVITPPVNLAAGEQLQAPITVVVEADSANEARIVAATPFSFRSTQLTPNITTVSPNSGPPQGGTIVTIFGSNFEMSNVQVLFGAAEARVIETHFDNIKVQTPSARDTTGTGSEPTTGFVSITVVNIASGTRTSLSNGFRYTPGMAITAISPNQGLYTGGTRVTIDGVGFSDPVAVSIAGIAARVIDARSGTKLIVETSAVEVSGCAAPTGPVIVTNISTGISAEGPSFIYKVPKPIILGVSGAPITPGSPAVIRVANPGLVPRIQIGDKNVSITAVTVNADGSASYTITVPSNLTLGTEACPAGGSISIPTSFSIVYTALDTGCMDTLTNGITVDPVALPRASVTPASLTLTARADVDSATPGNQPGPPGVASVTVSNTGTTTLVINSYTVSPGFTVSGPPANHSLASCETATITVSYAPGAAGSTTPGTLTIVTNANDPSVALTGSTQ